jgi:hypothetical protein
VVGVPTTSALGTTRVARVGWAHATVRNACVLAREATATTCAAKSTTCAAATHATRCATRAARRTTRTAVGRSTGACSCSAARCGASATVVSGATGGRPRSTNCTAGGASPVGSGAAARHHHSRNVSGLTADARLRSDAQDDDGYANEVQTHWGGLHPVMSRLVRNDPR